MTKYKAFCNCSRYKFRIRTPQQTGKTYLYRYEQILKEAAITYINNRNYQCKHFSKYKFSEVYINNILMLQLTILIPNHKKENRIINVELE